MSPHFHDVIRSDRATGEPPAEGRRTATNTRGSRRGVWGNDSPAGCKKLVNDIFVKKSGKIKDNLLLG